MSSISKTLCSPMSDRNASSSALLMCMGTETPLEPEAMRSEVMPTITRSPTSNARRRSAL